MSTQPCWEITATENGHIKTNTSMTINDHIINVVEFIISKLLVLVILRLCHNGGLNIIYQLFVTWTKCNQRGWVDCPRLKEVGQTRGAPKAAEAEVSLMVVEMDMAMQDMDVYRGQQDQIQPSSKEMKKDVKNIYSLQVMKTNKQSRSQG